MDTTTGSKLAAEIPKDPIPKAILVTGSIRDGSLKITALRTTRAAFRSWVVEAMFASTL